MKPFKGSNPFLSAKNQHVPYGRVGFFMLGMGFEPLFWRSQNETESLPLRTHLGCAALVTRQFKGPRLRRGRCPHRPAGLWGRGNPPTAPVGADCISARTRARCDPGSGGCGGWAWAHIQCAPTDPPMLLSQGQAKCIVSHTKNQQCRFDTADLLFIPLR